MKPNALYQVLNAPDSTNTYRVIRETSPGWWTLELVETRGKYARPQDIGNQMEVETAWFSKRGDVRKVESERVAQPCP